MEDRRGAGSARGMSAGRSGGLINVLLMLFMRGSAKMKLMLLVGLTLAFVVFRGQVFEILGVASPSPQGQVIKGGDETTRAYLATMMGDNEDVWGPLLAKYGIDYRPAKMIIYTEAVRTPGGMANAGMGPFYLSKNETIYIDPSFFQELKQKFKATGDFAEAYVVAHEYGHHIQQLLGRLDELHSQQGRVSKTEYNQKSVRVELQADFLAGLFAHHAEGTFRGFLEQGDIEEAMRCAQAIGDDRIQRDFGPGYVNPDSFTHGTSAQRARWFMEGFKSGDLRRGEQIHTLPYEQL